MVSKRCAAKEASGTDRDTASGEPVTLSGRDCVDGRAYRLSRPAPYVFSSERQNRFFDILAETSNVRLACKLVGISPTAVYYHRRTRSAFAARWRQALADAVADLKMRVAAQGRFGQVSETVISIGEQGERIIRTRRDSAAQALRTLIAGGADADSSDRDDQEQRDREDRELRLQAAERILLAAVKTARQRSVDTSDD